MTDSPALSPRTVAFGIAVGVASIANALLVIVKETHPAVMRWLKQAAGHHWAGHSLLTILIFLLTGFALARIHGGQGPRLSARSVIRAMVGGIAAGTLIIFGFYLLGG